MASSLHYTNGRGEGDMRARGFLACIVFVLISLVAASCTTGVSQEEYDSRISELAQTQEELATTKGNLSETEAMLAQAQLELEALRLTPATLEVVFVDRGGIARLTFLKVTKEAPEDTWVVECQLEQTGELPTLVNVVDVELYIEDRFIDSERWIDVSSSGFAVTKPSIRLDTGTGEFVESIELRIVPAFKVFGT